jgi:uncharacterized protein (TIGR02996 family)
MSLENSPNFLLNFSDFDVDSKEKHFYRFKSFRLNIKERQLIHNDLPVSLTPKAFDVLALLVERSDHLVEKDELLRIVWAESFVEEANIPRIIHTLRKTLGEGENGDKFIETVAKKGYRFVAKVEEVCETEAPKLKSDIRYSAITDENFPEAEFEIPQSEKDAPIAAEPKRATRIILFGIGFLSAVFLILSLSFNFQFTSSDNPYKIKSVAVLPLKPINTSARDEIYEFGIADSLIHRLSSTKGFFVRPLSATRKYGEIGQDPVAAGRELQVDYVLDSNYQLADGRIRVTAQLINVASRQIEETKIIEKAAEDLFGMQDAIASEIGNNLLARFAATPSSAPQERGTANEEAYRLYLHGKNLTGRRSAKDAVKAIEYFEQAIRLDPSFAGSYAAMAYAYRAAGTLGGGLPREQFEKAKKAVEKALELDNNLAEAYAVRGDIKYKYDWNFAEAEKDLLRAIELEPNNDLARAAYADLLLERGRFDEAGAEIETTLAIDPRSIVYQRDRGRFLYFARRYDEAVVQLKRVVELDENFETGWGWLWQVYEAIGDEPQAYLSFLELQKRVNPERVEAFQKAYENAGWQRVKREFLKFSKLNEQNPESNLFAIARLHALLGEKEQAFEYLYKAVEKRQRQVLMLNTDPAFDILRNDSRFEDLVKRVGLK